MERSVTSTRDKILIAAATMLGEDPTARLSVRAVAARAGVSAGSLRHFFPTQRALIDTVVAGMHSVEIPDDPFADASMTPTERLVACLQLLLAEVGSGQQAREYLSSLHRAYVASPPDDDAVHAFFALERLAVQQVASWLVALPSAGTVTASEVEGHARYLLTVVNGLALERALPGAQARMAFEADTLRVAASSIVTTLETISPT